MVEDSLSDKKISEVLSFILKKIKSKNFIWRLEGSLNLRVQSLKVSVRDIDITTSQEGILIFREALKDYIKKDFFNEKIKAHSLLCDMSGAELEINAYQDVKLNFFDEIKIKRWKGLKLPILPLESAKKFYEMISRNEKATLIENFLKTKNQ